MNKYKITYHYNTGQIWEALVTCHLYFLALTHAEKKHDFPGTFGIYKITIERIKK